MEYLPQANAETGREQVPCPRGRVSGLEPDSRHPHAYIGAGRLPPARRPYWVARLLPQPPAFGASFLSGLLQEPEPEEAAAGLSDLSRWLSDLVVSFLHHRGLPFQSLHSSTCLEEEPQGGPEPSCPARASSRIPSFPEAKQASSLPGHVLQQW